MMLTGAVYAIGLQDQLPYKLNPEFCTECYKDLDCPTIRPEGVLRQNIATGEKSPAITPYHTYHFSISSSLTFTTR